MCNLGTTAWTYTFSRTTSTPATATPTLTITSLAQLYHHTKNHTILKKIAQIAYFTDSNLDGAFLLFLTWLFFSFGFVRYMWRCDVGHLNSRLHGNHVQQDSHRQRKHCCESLHILRVLYWVSSVFSPCINEQLIYYLYKLKYHYNHGRYPR